MPSSKINDADLEDLITRSGLALRWQCHIETIKRRERANQLHPIRFSERMVRYRLSEVRAIEREAGVPHPVEDRKPSPSPQTKRKEVVVELS